MSQPPEEDWAQKSVLPQQISWLVFVPVGCSHNKEQVASYCNTKMYASSAAQERRESAEDGEDEEEDEDEEGREEEEEQRPLCSGVLGYPVVRDHTLGLGLSGAADAQAGDNTQSQTYKGDDRNTHLICLNSGLFLAQERTPFRKQISIFATQNNTEETVLITSALNKSLSCSNGLKISCESVSSPSKVSLHNCNWLRS